MAAADSKPSKSSALAVSVWAVTLPVLFAGISDTIIHATDTAFLARVGTLELTALAFADTLFDVWTVPILGLVGAMQIIIARRVGERRAAAAGATFIGGMVAALVLSLILAVALRLSAPYLSETIAESPEVARRIEPFLRIAAFGMVFYSLSLVYIALYIGMAQTSVLVSSTVVLALSNLFLSYVLILGRLGFPRLGIEGAAWAFVGAEALTFGFLTLRVARDGLREKFGGLNPWSRPPDFPFRRLAQIGSPISLQSLLEAVRWLAFFFVLQAVSEEAVAWSNILYAIYGALLIPTTAFAETIDALVSGVIGRGRADALGHLMRRVAKAAYSVTLPFLGVVLLFPDAVLSVFTGDPAAIHGAAPSLRVLGVAMLLVTGAELWLAAVAGTGATDIAFGIELFLSVMFVGLAYVAAIVLELPLAYAWGSLLIVSLMGLALSYWWVNGKRWIHREL